MRAVQEWGAGASPLTPPGPHKKPSETQRLQDAHRELDRYPPELEG